MDAYLAIVGKREVRNYESRPISEDVLTKILQAGRASGSSRNRQPWRLVVVADRDRLRELSEYVSRPGNVQRCAAAIVLVLNNPRAFFDAGRTGQNMMLAAWALGVGSCPNTPTDPDAVRRLLGIPEDMAIPIILSLGYPAPGEPRPRSKADPTRVLERINRLALDQLVSRESFAAG